PGDYVGLAAGRLRPASGEAGQQDGGRDDRGEGGAHEPPRLRPPGRSVVVRAGLCLVVLAALAALLTTVADRLDEVDDAEDPEEAASAGTSPVLAHARSSLPVGWLLAVPRSWRSMAVHKTVVHAPSSSGWPTASA